MRPFNPVPKPVKTEKPKPKGINRRSTKRAKQEREYLKLNKAFLEAKGKEHEDGLPRCEGKLTGCTIIATCVQHPYGRIGKLLTEVKYFKASCNNCNQRAEANPLEAQANNFSYSRLHK